MVTEVHCYNKGCGKTYNPDENSEESCIYHSGGPVFHEGYKSWSCCSKKRSTDFTEFLNIKGCNIGLHCNIKPVDPTRKPEEDKDVVLEREEIKPPERLVRPSVDSPMIPLPVTIASSLQKMLDNMDINGTETEAAKGAVCTRKACGVTRQDETSDSEPCEHHPGGPIFHEGMKYWSCCQKKTADFDVFLSQKGCTKGSHLWSDPNAKTANCRFDWHQTGDTVNVTVYAKSILPDKCTVECSPVKLSFTIVFGDNQTFTLCEELNGIVDPEKSKVSYYKMKAEVSMRKAEFVAWSGLKA